MDVRPEPPRLHAIAKAERCWGFHCATSLFVTVAVPAKRAVETERGHRCSTLGIDRQAADVLCSLRVGEARGRRCDAQRVHTDRRARGADARVCMRRSLVCAAEVAGDRSLDLRRSRRRDVVRGAPRERLVARRRWARARRWACSSAGHRRLRGRMRVGARRPSTLRRSIAAAAGRGRRVSCSGWSSARAAVVAQRAPTSGRR